MSKREIKRVSFSCPQSSEPVQVTLEYLHNRGMQALVGFDCSGCHNCGVGKQTSSTAWSFDWSKCVHPIRDKK